MFPTQPLIFIVIVLFGILYAQEAFEMKKASQCFKSRGIPKVAFTCPADHMIKIHRAFHGIAVNERTPIEEDGYYNGCEPSPGHTYSNCTMCDGDCIDDSMNLVYDWSTCMGNTSCIRTVMQSYMPSCPGPDKFSDYLQVEYQCVPRPEVIDICSHLEKTMEEGYIMSPNYPYNYPTNEDCLCRLYTDWSSRIILSLYDLLLETKNGRCRADWLMLRQKDQKHRHCGAIMTGTKNLTSETNSIEIQFHSDENDNRTQNFQYFTRSLKGFWLYFTAKPRGSVKVACRKLSQNDLQVQEIRRDDKEFEEVMSSQKEEEDGAVEMTTAKIPAKVEDKDKMDGMNNIRKEDPEEGNEDGKMKTSNPGRKNNEGAVNSNKVYRESKSSAAGIHALWNAVVCLAITCLITPYH